MDARVLLLYDGGLSEHWPDLLLSALLAVGGVLVAVISWFLKRDISSFDERHKRAENKFEKHDETLADHDKRITIIEKVKESRHF